MNRVSRIKSTVLAAVFSVAAGIVSSYGVQDTSYTNWPAEPDWVALTNHISQCYQGILQRCQASGMSTNVTPPTYINPFQDYLYFAQKIDEMAPNFVCTTNADVDGTFTTYFATPFYVEGQTNYPNMFPCWAVSNLHSAAGFTNWSTNLLTSWTLADRSIQKKVGDTLNLLRWTSPYNYDEWTSDASGSPTGNVGHVSSYYNDYITPPYDAPPDFRFVDSEKGVGDPDGPTCYNYVDAQNQAIANMQIWTNSGGYSSVYRYTGAVTGEAYGDQYWACWLEYVNSKYQVGDVNLNTINTNLTSLNMTCYGVVRPMTAPDIFDAQGSGFPDGQVFELGGASGLSHIETWTSASRIPAADWTTKNWPANPTGTVFEQGFFLDKDSCFAVWQWPYDASCNELHWSFPGVGSFTNATPADDLAMFSPYASSNLVAALVMDYGPPCIYSYGSISYNKLTTMGQVSRRAKLRLTGLSTNVLHTVDFYAQAGTIYENSDTDHAEFDSCGEPLYENKLCRFDVSTSTTASDIKSRFLGSLVQAAWFTPDSSKTSQCRGFQIEDYNFLVKWVFSDISTPQDLASDPALDADIDGIVEVPADIDSFGPDTGNMVFTVEQSQPAVIMPLVSTPVWYGSLPVHGYLYQGAFAHLPYAHLVSGQSDDCDGYYQAFSLATRIIESKVDSTNHIKQVSLLRPRGNMVVFDFSWTGTNQTYSQTGLPIGINSNRTYVLRDTTPTNNADAAYDLCFPSGITHRFVPSSTNGFSRLQQVMHADGRVVPVATYEPQYSIPGCTASNFLSQATNSAITMSDAKYNVTLNRDKGKLTSIQYRSKDGAQTITSTLGSDTLGHITSISKSGLSNIGSMSAPWADNPDQDGVAINYAWGTVLRCAYYAISGGPDGQQSTDKTVSILKTLTDGKFLASVTMVDPCDRVKEVRLTMNNITASTVYSYPAATDRYANGFPKNAKVAGITYPDLSSVSFTYESTNGWLSSETRPIGNGLSRVTEYSYSGTAGDPANPTNFIERPRSVQVKVGSQVVGKSLYSYAGGIITNKQCLDAAADWSSTNCLVNISAYDMGSSLNNGGRLLACSTPAVFSTNVYTASGTNLTIAHSGSDGRASQQILNNFGSTVFSSQSKDTQTVAQATSTWDSFGRILRTDYLDGTYTINQSYDFFGPANVIDIDGSTVNYLYTTLGQIQSINEPSIDNRTTTYQFDVRGNRINTTVTASGKSVSCSYVFDAQNRLVSETDLIGTTGYNYSSLANVGTRRITTPPNGVTTIEDFYFDGSLKEVSGSGSVAHRKYEYGIGSDNLLYTKESNADNTNEWSSTSFNLLGDACKYTTPNASGQPVTTVVAFDSCGRHAKSTDPNQVINLTSYNSKNEVRNSGLHVDGATDVLTPASNDRFNTATQTVNAAGIRNDTLVYPVPGSTNSAFALTDIVSIDGRKVISIYAGRTNTAVRGSYQSGGTYTVTTTNCDGTRIVNDYSKWRLDKVTLKDKNNLALMNEQYQYTVFGELEYVVNSKRGTMQYVYNQATHLLEKIIPFDTSKGNVSYVYYPNTARVKYINKFGVFTRYDYYDNGLVKFIYDGPNFENLREYDTQGRFVRMTTWQGNKAVTTEWHYDQYTGFLKEKCRFGLATPDVSYLYRDNGQLASATDGESVRTDFNYTGAGDLASAVTSDGSLAITSTFDRLGRFASLSKSNGIYEAFAYALDGSLVTNAVTGNGVVSNALMTYRYAADSGCLTSMNFIVYGSCTGTVRSVYDSAMRYSVLSNAPYSVVYSYATNAMCVTGMTWKIGTTNIMTRTIWWDFANMRVTNVLCKIGTSNIASYAYTFATNSDLIVKTKLLDGTYWQYSYDARQQLSKAIQYATNGVQILGRRFGYEYDSIGNMLRGGPLGTDGRPVNIFAVNELNFYTNRVWSNLGEVCGSAVTGATVTVNDVRASRQGTRFYAVVPVTNTAASLETNIVIYAVVNNTNSDTLASSTGKLFVAKAAEAVSNNLARGFVTQDSRFTYEWNRLNQLISVTSTNANPNFKLDFSYYADGRRAKKIVSTWNGSSWVGASTNCFYWDKWNMVAETVKKGTATTVRVYIYGLDLSGQKMGEPGQEAGGIGALAIITEKVNNGTPRVYFPVVNNIGSVMMLVDGGTKTVVANYECSPFGQPLLAKGSAKDSCPIRFQSQYYDKETGLIYWKHRYYDPEAGRFLSNDPSGEFHGGINLLSAFGNEPVNHIDGTGEKPILVQSDQDDVTSIKFVDSFDLYYLGWERAVVNGEKLPSIGMPPADQRSLRDGESLRMMLGNGMADAINGLPEISYMLALGIDKGAQGAGALGTWLERLFPMDVQMACMLATQEYPNPLTGLGSIGMALTTKGGRFLNTSARFLRFADAESRLARVEASLLRVRQASLEARGGWVASPVVSGASLFDKMAIRATMNPESRVLVLGRGLEDVSYTKVAAHYKATYFKVENWRKLMTTMTEDEVWEINEAFLVQQIKQGKQIILSHDPATALRFFKREVDFLNKLGYRFVKDGWVWKAVR